MATDSPFCPREGLSYCYAGVAPFQKKIKK
jgi:hypothetical protein